MECRCLLFDLDGTLLRSDKSISPRTLRALEACRERGLRIGISTNRAENRAKPFLDLIKPEVVISSGGALVRRNGVSLAAEAGWVPSGKGDASGRRRDRSVLESSVYAASGRSDESGCRRSL